VTVSDGNRLWQARVVPELDARLQAHVDRGHYDRTSLVRAGLVLALALQQHVGPDVIAKLGERDGAVAEAIALADSTLLITATCKGVITERSLITATCEMAAEVESGITSVDASVGFSSAASAPKASDTRAIPVAHGPEPVLAAESGCAAAAEATTGAGAWSADAGRAAVLAAQELAAAEDASGARRRRKVRPDAGIPSTRHDAPCVAFMRAAESASGGAFRFAAEAAEWLGPPKRIGAPPDAGVVFIRGALRLRAYPKLEDWTAYGLLHAHIERPLTPLGPWEVVSDRNFDAKMRRAQQYAAKIAALGGDLLEMPRRLAAYLDRKASSLRLHVSADLRLLDQPLVHRLGDIQLVDDGKGGHKARTESEWRALGDWIVAGGLEWLRSRGTSSLSLVELASNGGRWFTQADGWVDSGRPAIKAPAGSRPSPTAQAFAEDDEDSAEFLRRKLNGGA
jgi:hypothetical protein